MSKWIHNHKNSFNLFKPKYLVAADGHKHQKLRLGVSRTVSHSVDVTTQIDKSKQPNTNRHVTQLKV